MSTSCMPVPPISRRRTFYATLLGLALAGAAPAAAAAPDADLWPYWETHDPASERSVDHDAWAAFLEQYVVAGDDGINRVRYGGVTGADGRALDGYIDRLAGIRVTELNRDEQFAYWVNLYNALTVDVVLEHYPVDSIRDIDISPGFFASGPWGRELVTVEGRELTLDDIEHRILRPIWREPRVHYAVNCAALGCPNLMTRPWRAGDLDACLDRQARHYVNHPRGARFEGGELVVSSIYEWFQDDFGGDEAGVIEHLKRHAEPAFRQRLEQAADIDDDEYDWSLNDAG